MVPGVVIATSRGGDPGNNKRYWRQLGDVYRANLGGSDATLIYTEGDTPNGIDVDRSDGRLCLLVTSGSDTVVRRMEADETGIVDIATVLGESPFGLGFGVSGGRVY